MEALTPRIVAVSSAAKTVETLCRLAVRGTGLEIPIRPCDNGPVWQRFSRLRWFLRASPHAFCDLVRSYTPSSGGNGGGTNSVFSVMVHSPIGTTRQVLIVGPWVIKLGR